MQEPRRLKRVMDLLGIKDKYQGRVASVSPETIRRQFISAFFAPRSPDSAMSAAAFRIGWSTGAARSFPLPTARRIATAGESTNIGRACEGRDAARETCAMSTAGRSLRNIPQAQENASFSGDDYLRLARQAWHAAAIQMANTWERLPLPPTQSLSVVNRLNFLCFLVEPVCQCEYESSG